MKGNWSSEEQQPTEYGIHLSHFGRHDFGSQYILSTRDMPYPDRADSQQTRGTVSLVYTFLAGGGFGAVNWRGADSR